MQALLPLTPLNAMKINNMVSLVKTEAQWYYFMGLYPVYSHSPNDIRMFHLVLAQLIESGACRQADILKAFCVSKSNVIRSQHKLRKGGSEAFFKKREGRKGGTVLTPALCEKAQELLNQGESRANISKELGIQYDTLRKAISDGRLKDHKIKNVGKSKSERTVIDAAAAESMGTACTRVTERALAAFGQSFEAPALFEKSLDVPNGGVLCALPALLANGLLEKATDILGRVNGYYNIIHVLLTLAFVALCRIKVVDRLKGHAPGEFGKLLGLDRSPEVKCLRNKMEAMSRDEAAERWAAHLSRYWLESDVQAAGFLYIDGHVRVYHGGLTKLPRKYVSRDRLCLRGTTDYWVNDAIGRPFFVVEKQIDPGMLKTLSESIIPQLLEDVPDQFTSKEYEENPYLCRFVLVIDREGYSPEFFRMVFKNHRIACLTYHKHPKDSWPVEWFEEQEVTMPRGEKVSIKLAEMGTLVGSGKNSIWMKEVRKLTESGHQTSLISSAYELPHTKLAAHMFSRWCQENFFGYMMKHFAIDLLQEYGVEEFPDTELVVNPLRREKERLHNATRNKLRYRYAKFAELSLAHETEDDKAEHDKWIKPKAELLEDIEGYENQLKSLKSELKEIPRHIKWKDLKESDRFRKLKTGRKRLMDTVRMISYRAETAMVNLLLDKTVNSADARRTLQNLFVTEADILPDPCNNILRIRVHCSSTPASNRSISKMLDELNAAEINYPGTELKLVYELADQYRESGRVVSNELHRGQVV